MIPAYQPTLILLELLKEFHNAGCHILIVDDGSSKDYAALFAAAEPYATVLSYEENRGKGFALKFGLTAIYKEFGEDCTVVTVDADGQHRVSDALQLLAEAEQNPESLILGSRKIEKQTPAKSKLGNTLTRAVYQLSTKTKVYDTQTGLRAFSGRMIPTLLEIPGDRYEYEMNMLLTLANEHIPMVELPVETVYLNNNSGSHFHPVRDSYRIYKEILKFSASSFVSFLVDYAIFSLLAFFAGESVLFLSAANIGARVVSSTVNYNLNRKLVFKSKVGKVKSALQYFLLAAMILAGNTLLLDFLAVTLGWNRWLAKLLCELFFFALSWTVQRFIIFKKEEEK